MIRFLSRYSLPIVIIAILYLFVSDNIFSQSPFVIAGQILAVLLGLWAWQTFQYVHFSIHAEPAGGPLLMTGPFYFIRHPMYASTLLFFWSSIAGNLSFFTVITGLIVTMVIFIRIIAEEGYLRSHYPEYEAYSYRTKRIIPFVY